MKKQISNPFILALTAHNLTVEIHKHSAYQVVLSNDAPFTSTIHGKVCKVEIPSKLTTNFRGKVTTQS
ncbi:hypothetical protein [Chryseolinea serpens]|nr:hypothetical protein [Chryseolinea serpens]